MIEQFNVRQKNSPFVPLSFVFEKTMFRLDHPACLDFEQSDINQIKVLLDY